MSHLIFALGVFLLVFASSLAGLWLARLLPSHHLSKDSAKAIRLAIGLVATIAALVLGLLISSAKSSFDAINNDLVHNAANMIRLDSTLAQYGPEAQALRATLRRDYGEWIDLLVSRSTTRAAGLDSPGIILRMEEFQHSVAMLTPADDHQRALRTRALAIADEVFASRSLALLQRGGSLPKALMFVLVFWLAIIFGTFGVLAPRNGSVVVAFLACALCAAGAVFLILEMDTPLDGIVRVSIGAMREALARMGGV
ncbi:hypothetical protein [Caballeronia sp. J97]|uniref:bestrophin-like domain n=1 Tax=Caballeronia sp. J97 TaxID=2805429 RepID=UPI002AB07E4E|nr:hypothetical protein [Caballeronia sp. J97]